MGEIKSKIYLETSIVSYLTARLSRDLITAANQQITQDWWEKRRLDFDLYTSQLILDEASRGDTKMAQKRLETLQSISLLEINDEAALLAEEIIRRKLLPLKAAADASHIAIAAVHRLDYLLTWNCTHIANAEIFPKVYNLCRANGYEPPVICTPIELLGA
jgi:hypothetical protein